MKKSIIALLLCFSCGNRTSNEGIDLDKYNEKYRKINEVYTNVEIETLAINEATTNFLNKKYTYKAYGKNCVAYYKRTRRLNEKVVIQYEMEKGCIMTTKEISYCNPRSRS